MGGRISIALALLLFLGGCDQDESHAGSGPRPDDCRGDGLTLPAGFCARVFADRLGPARHLAVRDNGDVYVALREGPHALVALRDSDGDGLADRTERLAGRGATGIAIRDDWLYLAHDTTIVRYRLAKDALLPSGDPEVVVAGFPEQTVNAAKTLAFDRNGGLYTSVGAPSNACQHPPRQVGAAGLDPCPQRARQAGIWRFEADGTGQDAANDGVRYARGIRNAVANAWHDEFGALYAVQHGRDRLAQLWPGLFSVLEGVILPAEEMFAVDAGDDFGWPYCYWDPVASKKLLAPEYGGDGDLAGRCAQFEAPIAAFPAHWAPNAMLFYRGRHFPSNYRHGAFIAFHGSWNRAPAPQAGYNVTFQPMRDGAPSGAHEVFADGFAGAEPVTSPCQARHRPTGLAEGPDGHLYISDSVRGRVWRVSYTTTPESAHP